MTDPLASAAQVGRIAALAAAGERDLRRRVAEYPDLFADRSFDAALLHAVALANATAAPESTVDALRVADRATLFVFALDRLVDAGAADPGPALADCRAVAAGAPAVGDLGRLLAVVRADIPSGRRPFWSAALDKTITAMERERRWLAGPGPSFAEYLDNADNTGFVFVAVSHWLRTLDGLSTLDGLLTAARAGQRVLRLVNDLATHDRDAATGDLNALALVDRSTVEGALDRETRRFRRLLDGLEPAQGAVLARQIGFAVGFYDVTDFWGGR
ncbi:hypothetical protein Val02_04060 [Virgisporangium aliadipatigenens]|uniref:Terpene synthase n=1 Tax=Virgisporangium aliadipatigenens TaxID=741659 RepID=A0A8J3YGA1_9ACTN|nr:terpene synthase family protein [Virgisporangium aliadipatigenens]GIJ43520.1 hypothetical protein Val02_04060 [Virgisporangium aliadipatigenens]